MGCVQQAVLEFDEEVRAPWRPRLVAGGADAAAVRPARGVPPRSSSRVGACRPPAVPAGAAGVRRPDPQPIPPRPASGRPAPTRLRLTRRARRLAVVLALAAGVALGSWISPLLTGGGGDLQLAGGSSVVVQPGDTLWSIASALGGEGDVRTVIDQIQRLNDLAGADLVPGQVLLLP